MARNPLAEYHEAVPEETRNAIFRFIDVMPMDGYDDFIVVTKFLLANVAAGRVSTDTAAQVKSLLEILLTGVTAREMRDAAHDESGDELAALLYQAEQRAAAKVPQITIDAVGTDIVSQKIEFREKV